MRCPWRREQLRSDHGRLSRYGRRCRHQAGHADIHETPVRAKQANTGVWYNPETGETVTQ